MADPRLDRKPIAGQGFRGNHPHSSIRVGHFFESTTDPFPYCRPLPLAARFWPPGPRRLKPIDVEDMVYNVYDHAPQGGETLRESIFRILGNDVPWSFYGAFRITTANSDRPTVLVALKPNHHAGPATNTEQRLAASILKEMDRRGCSDQTDLLLIDGEVSHAVGEHPAVLPPGFEITDISATLKAAPELGCSIGTGTSSGSLGFWVSISLPNETPEVLAVTCHHCVCQDASPLPPPSSPGCPPSGPIVEAPSQNDRRLWAASLKAVVAASTAAGAPSTATAAQENLLDLIADFTTPLGTVVCSSGITGSSTQGRYLNWAAIRVEPSRVSQGIFNNNNMSDETRKAVISAWTRVAANGKPHMYKTGRTTGTTLGRPSPIDIDIRHEATSQRPSFYTRDKSVLALHTPFASSGDSGALVHLVDATGSTSPMGLLFGGGDNPSTSPLAQNAEINIMFPDVVSSDLQNQNIQISDLVFYTPIGDIVDDIRKKLSQVYGANVLIVPLN